MRTNSHHRLLLAAAAVSMVLRASLKAGFCADTVFEHTLLLDTDKLHLVIADNEAYGAEHRAGYNGVAELRLGSGDAKNLLVPLYAGLNLEHVFSGDATSFGWNIFEPRRARMQLAQLSRNRAELRQERTEHWPLRSRMVYEAHEDAIDFTYSGTPLADAWAKHGYIGIFFASYIQAPEDMAIQFIGRTRPGRDDSRPRWIRHLPEKHGLSANHRPAGSQWDPTFDDGFKVDLVKGSSDLEYLYPFYFGQSGHEMFVLMFERTNEEGELRFAQSPSGGGKGNPAWDFVYFRRRYEVGREFSFRARAVYRKFTGPENAARLYEQWSGEKVALPER